MQRQPYGIAASPEDFVQVLEAFREALANFNQQELPFAEHRAIVQPEIQHTRLEADDGIVYRYETSRRARLRQLRTRVVPPAIRRVLIHNAMTDIRADDRQVQRWAR